MVPYKHIVIFIFLKQSPRRRFSPPGFHFISYEVLHVEIRENQVVTPFTDHSLVVGVTKPIHPESKVVGNFLNGDSCRLIYKGAWPDMRSER